MENLAKEIKKRRMTENREPCFSVDFDGGRVVLLDEDALMEILVRLPLKCVIRFKLVCKSWLSLISTDEFRRLHTLRRHKPSLSLILDATYSRNRRELFYSNPVVERSGKLRTIPYPVTVISEFKILNCSNGLMLLQRKDYNDYYVYNPTTNQSKKVRFARNGKFIRVVSLHLVFDPSESPHYELFCFRLENEHPGRHLVEVFNSGSGTWRVCMQPFATNAEIKHFANCARYKSLIFFRDTYDGCIHCFDIVTNDSQLIACPIPNRVADSVYSHSFQESNGSLYYCALLIDDECKKSAALWKLHVNEDDPCRSDWWLLYEESLHFFPDRSGPIVLTLIAETSTVLIHAPENIVAFNFLDKSCNVLLDLEPSLCSADVHHFGETLALL